MQRKARNGKFLQMNRNIEEVRRMDMHTVNSDLLLGPSLASHREEDRS